MNKFYNINDLFIGTINITIKNLDDFSSGDEYITVIHKENDKYTDLQHQDRELVSSYDKNLGVGKYYVLDEIKPFKNFLPTQDRPKRMTSEEAIRILYDNYDEIYNNKPIKKNKQKIKKKSIFRR